MNVHLSGRYLIGFLACTGFFVAGMAVDRSFANPVVAEAQASEYIGISTSFRSDASLPTVCALKSNGDVEFVDISSNQRILHRRADAKVESAKELRLRDLQNVYRSPVSK